ncbi:MAG: ankyrin repeat domain-containing protein, partial [Thermosynechococcaceae cyanobacterium]
MGKFSDAAFDGDIETVAKWIEVSSKQKNKIKVFAEPLSYAAQMGHVEIVQLFLNAGADINYVFKEGTALHYAAQGTGMPAHIMGENSQNTEVAKILIEAGTDLSLTDHPKSSNYTGWTALMTAACHGRAAIAKMLIAAGSDINARDKTGMTPLMIAADFGAVSVAELLIQAGAFLDIKDDRGLTALGYVARDIDVGIAEIEEELRPMQAFQKLAATPAGDAQTMLPSLFSFLGNAENLERSRRGQIARMLRRAGASDAVCR